jgi:hypothetical protein
MMKSISLKQTSNNKEWAGFPELLLPLAIGSSESQHIMQFTSTTHPDGNNVKTLHLDNPGIFLIAPAWKHVLNYFKYLPTNPDVFSRSEMSSIMQIGDRFYRLSKNSHPTSTEDDAPSLASTLSAEESVKRQLLVTLTSPRIIFVADATRQQSDTTTLTVYLSNMNYLSDSSPKYQSQTVVCDGLEIFTGLAKQSPTSSLLCPLSVCGSVTKTISKESPPHLKGWIWMEEIKARASYIDLTSTIDVCNGVETQAKGLSDVTSQETTKMVEMKNAGDTTQSPAQYLV